MEHPHHRYHSGLSDSSTSSDYSDGSYYSHHSESTAATSYSPVASPISRRYKSGGPTFRKVDEDVSPATSFDPRASTETYTSTIASEEYLDEQEDDYEVPNYRTQALESDAIPASPSEFADLFPSSRKLHIAHDDSTSDGNMNLRVDTNVSGPGGRREAITLFHLRMHDLKHREFSFRRYCRDSGREVCHSSRKVTKKPVNQRPALQRSVSSALATLMGKSESISTHPGMLNRHDSGYGSGSDNDHDSPSSTDSKNSKMVHEVSNMIKLEFSNYANVEIHRQGSKASRRYDFEYWGTKYSWKRLIQESSHPPVVSYQLVNLRTNKTVAFINPDHLNPAQAYEEELKNGWIRPCHMRIIDSKVNDGSTDVGDVIVATGLIALVDDSIKRRFHQKRTMQLIVPLPKTSPLKLEYIGPKKLIDEMFNRKTSIKPKSSRRNHRHILGNII